MPRSLNWNCFQLNLFGWSFWPCSRMSVKSIGCDENKKRVSALTLHLQRWYKNSAFWKNGWKLAGTRGFEPPIPPQHRLLRITRSSLARIVQSVFIFVRKKDYHDTSYSSALWCCFAEHLKLLFASQFESWYNATMTKPDPATLKIVAALIRTRMDRLSGDQRLDGLERLGAYREFNQLAKDLDATAVEFTRDEKW